MKFKRKVLTLKFHNHLIKFLQEVGSQVSKMIPIQVVLLQILNENLRWILSLFPEFNSNKYGL